MRSSARLLALIIGGFLLASVANVFWEVRVVPNTQYEDRIFAFRDDGRLVTLTRTVTNPFASKELFLLATGLLETAEDGVLVAPNPNPVDEYTINTLARMSITIEDYQSELTDEEARQLLELAWLEGDGRLGGPGSDLVHWYLVPGPDEPTPKTMRLLFHKSSAFFVDETLVEELRS